MIAPSLPHAAISHYIWASVKSDLLITVIGPVRLLFLEDIFFDPVVVVACNRRSPGEAEPAREAPAPGRISIPREI